MNLISFTGDLALKNNHSTLEISHLKRFVSGPSDELRTKPLVHDDLWKVPHLTEMQPLSLPQPPC